MNERKAPARIGRFNLLRELGRGAQATVWLAHDTRLDREVALKLLDANGSALALDEWLHEARAVSRLAHPNIVPVFEADESGAQPYLVFELVQGPTLTAHLRERGGLLPEQEAVTLMLGVLDALVVAHDQGIVHRDLKPSNVLIDAQGRPRVMDFGIAARFSANPEGEFGEAGTICGTPGYISPEAARGAAPQPAMDVFAAGVMLAEMITGERLLVDRNPMRALERVQRDDLLVAEHDCAGRALDPGLREIVQRALARQTAERHGSAAALRDALARWQNKAQPAAQAVATPDSSAGSGQATVDFLLRRMKHRGDFPALSDAVSRIQRVADSDSGNASTLADEILKDVALTNKLLRVVNSAYYSQAGGAVSTVSRAVALIGFAGIRNLALSLVLVEHMQDKRHAEQLKEEFLRALMAATLADELTPVAREAEQCFLAAIFQNLGRLLVEFYLPEEASQIRALARPASATRKSRDESSATQQVLGIRFDALGVGVAQAWGLPETLQRAMRTPHGDAPTKAIAAGGTERQRWLGRLASESADALLDAADGQAPRLDVIAERYGRALGIKLEHLQAAAEASQKRLAQMAQAMQLQLNAKARARRLLASGEARAVIDGDDSLTPHTLTATAVLAADPAMSATLPTPRPTGQVAEMLAQGVQDITNHMVADQFELNAVLRMILETMFRALGFRRVVFCLRDPRTHALTGRFGLGERAAEVVAVMRVPLNLTPGTIPDLFSAVCSKGVDTLIADATQGAVATRLPAWFRQQVNAPSFLLLPLMMKGAPFALIYADRAQPGAMLLDEKELALLRTLRNQGVMAFRQAG